MNTSHVQLKNNWNMDFVDFKILLFFHSFRWIWRQCWKRLWNMTMRGWVSYELYIKHMYICKHWTVFCRASWLLWCGSTSSGWTSTWRYSDRKMGLRGNTDGENIMKDVTAVLIVLLFWSQSYTLKPHLLFKTPKLNYCVFVLHRLSK